ncbi:glycerate kinase [Paenibacillus sp. N4]|uniref:glycerate kinase n=1 Tax=Paenibacillus vietnamensis TaxID=2590547 RepID=UPI001CD0B7CF|nr:glycerate kinase [Paenibacillus vietnamensis]MCA0757182.1 glycerate kinase [Paenibacillus vietnamensis]
MKIIIAPDSFKGSISAQDLCESIRGGIEAVVPSAEAVELPMADGGEGTLDALIYATKGTKCECEVKDPLGRPVKASYGIMGDGQTVMIEMAQASGLTLLQESDRNPLITSSYGTGELIRRALRAGYRKFVVGLGGSATNDGGAGMLRALGASFTDESGAQIPEGGAGLAQLSAIDLSGLDSAVRESAFRIAGDVTNPLCGPSGASSVFGPQKGATEEMVRRLDEALNRYGEVLLQVTGTDVRQMPGSGAAGGMGAALLAVLQAESGSGIDLVMEAVDFEDKLQGASMVITGEGRLDRQTLSGKVIAGICRKARANQIPVIALCGRMDLTAEEMDELGLTAAFSIVPGPCTLEEAMAGASLWARLRTEQIMRLYTMNR